MKEARELSFMRRLDDASESSASTTYDVCWICGRSDYAITLPYAPLTFNGAQVMCATVAEYATQRWIPPNVCGNMTEQVKAHCGCAAIAAKTAAPTSPTASNCPDLVVQGNGQAIVRRSINEALQMVTIQLEWSGGLGWLAFGFSETGSMVPSVAVIGLPDTDEVLKYNLINRTLAGVVPSVRHRQTLIEASIHQVLSESKTILTFSRNLVDPGDVTVLSGDGVANGQTCMWAGGYNNTLGMHAVWGVFSLNFANCAGANEPLAPKSADGTSPTPSIPSNEWAANNASNSESASLRPNPTTTMPSTGPSPKSHAPSIIIPTSIPISSNVSLNGTFPASSAPALSIPAAAITSRAPLSSTDPTSSSNASGRLAGFTIIGILAVAMIGMAATVMLMWWIGNRIWTRRRVEATVTVNGAVRDALANRENGNSADHEANVSVVGSGTDNDFYKQCIQGRTHPQERERRPKVVDVGMNHDNRSVTTSATAFASIVADDDDAVPLVDAQPYSPHTPVVTFQNAQ